MKSEKKSFARRYRRVAPIDVATRETRIPNHLPKTNPANNKIGAAKPNSKTQIILKIKNEIDKKRKLLFLY
tara:strand:+ start:72 stop:284 length:213 start_codon:yes stop_codon:yes gene_type:complete